MHKIIVNYPIPDELYERLKKITEEYKSKGLDFTPDQMFENIMCTGSAFDIDNKLKFHEWKLGLINDYK